MSLSKKILSNTLWQIIGRLVTAFIGILSIKLITNFLPTDIYGQYTTIFEYIGFFAIAADFGLYTIGIREMSKKDQPTKYILGNLLSLRILLVVLCLGAALIATPFIPKYSGTLVQKGLWIVALGTALNLISGILTSVLQYKMQMLYANIALIIGKISGFTYIAYIILSVKPDNLETGFNLLLAGGIITNLVLLLLTIYFTKKVVKIKPQVDRKYILKIIKHSLPYGLSIILSAMYFKIDIILLSQLTDYHQTGIYGVPLKIMEIISVIPVFFMNASLPALTEHFQTNKIKYQLTSQKCITFLLLLGLPIVAGGFLLSKSITYSISSPQFLSGYHCTNNIQYVYHSPVEAYSNCNLVEFSPKFNWKESTETQTYTYFHGADLALQVIIIAILFNFINTFINFSFITIERQNLLLYINSIGIIFNVITNLILIPKYGFLAAAATTLASEIIILLIGYTILKKFSQISLSEPNTIFKILLSTTFMSAVIVVLKPFTQSILGYNNILILIPLGALTYGISILALQVIPLQTIKNFINKNE
jgi:O-antigen/teichoic acid export membrane protein